MRNVAQSRSPRITPAHTVFVEYPDHLARVRNISISGAYIEDQRALTAGRTVQFKLWWDDFKPLSINGVIRRVERGSGVGVEFLGMSPKDYGHLQNCLGQA